MVGAQAHTDDLKIIACTFLRGRKHLVDLNKKKKKEKLILKKGGISCPAQGLTLCGPD